MPPDLWDVNAEGEWACLGVEESQERTEYITLAQHKHMQKMLFFLAVKSTLWEETSFCWKTSLHLLKGWASRAKKGTKINRKQKHAFGVWKGRKGGRGEREGEKENELMVARI